MTPFIRVPHYRYEDPLARVWIVCAEHIGFRVARTTEAYASTDGRGTLLIGADELLDPDDSLAQMILHELCHALVEGEAGEGQTDWGLDNTSGRHTWRERATLRLQAYLTAPYGLRDFFAPTTDFRVKFWDSLPDDPFWAAQEAGGRRERSCVAARLAAWRATQARWAPHLRAALAASAAIAAVTPRGLRHEAVGGHASPLSPSPSPARGEGGEALPSLWSTVVEPPVPHPAGHAALANYPTGQGCADCAWSHAIRGNLRCRHAPAIKLPADAPTCARWEPASELDCQTCGACCREAYHSVEVGPREPVVKRHPDLVLKLETHSKLRRDGDRCAALQGGHTPDENYACAIYEDRPRTCREFTRGSANCLDARRRVGLSL